MGPSVNVNWAGGHRCADIGTFIHVHFICHTDLWIGDRGDNPSHWEVPGGVQPPGGMMNRGGGG